MLPSISFSGQDVSCFYLINPSSLNSKLILIDGDDLLVYEDGFVLGPDGPKVHGHEKWGSKDGPHGHLGLALLVAQAEVANDQLEKTQNL